MIKSKKTFYKIIKSDKRRFGDILSNLDKYYYEKKEIKYDIYGQPRMDAYGKIKHRILHPSTGELKFTQQRIKNIILNRIKFSSCAYGGIKKRNNILNAKCHKGNRYKFVTDIDNFFPSIIPLLVYNSLIKEDFSPDVASLITNATTYKNCVPQGAPTSTHIANLVFKEIDRELNEICEHNSITYSRFVDDLSFSSSKDFKSLIGNLIRIVTNYGFKISHRKTKYGKSSMEITGIWVRNNELEVSDTMKDKLAHPDLYTMNQNDGNKYYSKRVRSN